MLNIPVIDKYVILVRENRDYRNLWLSQVISQTGDWFNLIASAALIAQLSGSGLAIGGLFIARLLPPFVLTPVVGVVADRFNRRKILLISDLLRFFIVLGFLLVRTEADIWLLYTLTVVQLSISAFFEPTRSAILPSLVPRKDLVTANALSGTTWSTMLAFGAALGGVATALFGITAAFLIDAATFLVSAWFVLQIRLAADAFSQQDSADGRYSGWTEFVDGLRFLRRYPTILVLALTKASAALAFGGMAVVEVTFAEEYFPLGDDGSGTLGLIYFVTGIGTGLGPIIAHRVTGDRPIPLKWAIWLTYLMMIVGYVTIGFSSTLAVVLIGTFFRTAGSGISWVFSSSLLQMSVPDKLLGRVFAFDFAALTLTASLSTLWVGWVRDSFGWTPQQISLALGVIPMIMVVAWGLFLVIEVRRRDRMIVEPSQLSG